MMFSFIEWMVVIFALIGLAKAAVFATNRKKWIPVIEFFYGNYKWLALIWVIVAAALFYYLIMEITIVQLIAAGIFVILMVHLAFMQYPQATKEFGKKIMSSKIGLWMWIYILIWLVLLAWAIWKIFQ